MEQAENRKVILTAVQCTVRELNTSSSSSESEDDEMEIIKRYARKRKKVPQVENYVEVIVAALTNEQFKAHFRMSCDTFDYILSIIEPQLQRQINGTPTICPCKQFLLALWRLATPDSLRSICERFNVGRSTAFYITRRVINALITLAPLVIRWPTGERVHQTSFGFEAISNFPKLIGAIDGTHINIPAPNPFFSVKHCAISAIFTYLENKKFDKCYRYSNLLISVKNLFFSVKR